MFKKTNDISEILIYMKENLHSNVPNEFWDSELWFYSNMLDHIKSIGDFSSSDDEDTTLYSFKENDRVNGIAYCQIFKDYVLLLIDTDELEKVVELIKKLKHKLELTIRVYVVREVLVQTIMKSLNTSFKSDFARLMLFDTDLLSEVTDDYSSYRIVGYNELIKLDVPSRIKDMSKSAICYGKYEKEELICLCCIVPKTINKAEIVHVDSFIKSDNAHELINEIIKFSIKDLSKIFKVFSFKADIEDVKMINMISDIGFVQIYKEYFADIE